eukprot:CAMPEP_0172301588 /NCGR_PEP_ID=MMETSP1058-20130122/3436_1 /TAXON_ID=83371 /ORGANISM="Detonula confervacea, Strain CCMP 353" /LENGTH=754 /DNA_ID=CAMNT_0013011757 /DNA_START=111 /DNA_END=2372 /DNA_ORIENTATION=-
MTFTAFSFSPQESPSSTRRSKCPKQLSSSEGILRSNNTTTKSRTSLKSVKFLLSASRSNSNSDNSKAMSSKQGNSETRIRATFVRKKAAISAEKKNLDAARKNLEDAVARAQGAMAHEPKVDHPTGTYWQNPFSSSPREDDDAHSTSGNSAFSTATRSMERKASLLGLLHRMPADNVSALLSADEYTPEAGVYNAPTPQQAAVDAPRMHEYADYADATAAKTAPFSLFYNLKESDKPNPFETKIIPVAVEQRNDEVSDWRKNNPRSFANEYSSSSKYTRYIETIDPIGGNGDCDSVYSRDSFLSGYGISSGRPRQKIPSGEDCDDSVPSNDGTSSERAESLYSMEAGCDSIDSNGSSESKSLKSLRSARSSKSLRSLKSSRSFISSKSLKSSQSSKSTAILDIDLPSIHSSYSNSTANYSTANNSITESIATSLSNVSISEMPCVLESQPLGGPKYYIATICKRGQARIIHEAMPSFHDGGGDGEELEEEKGYEILDYHLVREGERRVVEEEIPSLPSAGTWFSLGGLLGMGRNDEDDDGVTDCTSATEVTGMAGEATVNTETMTEATEESEVTSANQQASNVFNYTCEAISLGYCVAGEALFGEGDDISTLASYYTCATGRTNATEKTSATGRTGATGRTSATGRTGISGATGFSRQTEVSGLTGISRVTGRTEATTRSGRTEATTRSERTEATNGSKSTEATNRSRRTEATARSVITEATNRSRRTEATNRSKMTEATAMSVSTEATNRSKW